MTKLKIIVIAKEQRDRGNLNMNSTFRKIAALPSMPERAAQVRVILTKRVSGSLSAMTSN